MINIFVATLIVLGVGSMVEFYTATFPLFGLIAILLGVLYFLTKFYKGYVSNKATRLDSKLKKEELKEKKNKNKGEDNDTK